MQELCKLVLKRIREIQNQLDDCGVSSSKKYDLRNKLEEQKEIYFSLVREG